MSAGWVAGSVRAIALAERRLGVTGARSVASAGSVAAAQRLLAAGPYRRGIEVGATAAETGHAVAATMLWQLRVLAGWQPQAGARLVRALAGGFEAANIRGLAAGLGGEPRPPVFDSGALTRSWKSLRDAGSLPELAAALGDSAWGRPGAATVAEIADVVLVAWAARVATEVTAAADWAAGAAAVLVARRLFCEHRPFAEPVGPPVRSLLGAAAFVAPELPGYVAALPAGARWVLTGLDSAAELWRAEPRWWARVDDDGRMLLHRSRFGPDPVVGAVAVLAADMWRVRAALQVAAGFASIEVFDELV